MLSCHRLAPVRPAQVVPLLHDVAVLQSEGVTEEEWADLETSAELIVRPRCVWGHVLLHAWMEGTPSPFVHALE